MIIKLTFLVILCFNLIGCGHIFNSAIDDTDYREFYIDKDGKYYKIRN